MSECVRGALGFPLPGCRRLFKSTLRLNGEWLHNQSRTNMMFDINEAHIHISIFITFLKKYFFPQILVDLVQFLCFKNYLKIT